MKNKISLLLSIALIIQKILTQKEYSSELQIFICADGDFTPKVSKSNVYKILSDNSQSLKGKYNLEVIPTDENNELYFKKTAYADGAKMYYIWKNYRPLPKYIGFVNYQRYFTFLDDIPDLDSVFENNDVIIPPSNNVSPDLEGDAHKNHIHYFEDMKEIIKEKYPQYYESVVNTLSSQKAYWKSMFIMKSEDFIEYGDFVFGSMIEWDKKHDLNTDTDIIEWVTKEIPNHTEKRIYLEAEKTYQYKMMERMSTLFYMYKFKNPYHLKYKEFADYEVRPKDNDYSPSIEDNKEGDNTLTHDDGDKKEEEFTFNQEEEKKEENLEEYNLIQNNNQEEDEEDPFKEHLVCIFIILFLIMALSAITITLILLIVFKKITINTTYRRKSGFRPLPIERQMVSIDSN